MTIRNIAWTVIAGPCWSGLVSGASRKAHLTAWASEHMPRYSVRIRDGRVRAVQSGESESNAGFPNAPQPESSLELSFYHPVVGMPRLPAVGPTGENLREGRFVSSLPRNARSVLPDCRGRVSPRSALADAGHLPESVTGIQHPTVASRGEMFGNGHAIIRVDADQVGIERGMVDRGQQRQGVRHDGLTGAVRWPALGCGRCDLWRRGFWRIRLG